MQLTPTPLPCGGKAAGVGGTSTLLWKRSQGFSYDQGWLWVALWTQYVLVRPQMEPQVLPMLVCAVSILFPMHMCSHLLLWTDSCPRITTCV